MKKTNKRSSLITGLLFSLAIVLLGVSTVGSTRAALQYESEIIVSEFRMREIGIDITDGSETIPGDRQAGDRGLYAGGHEIRPR